MPYFWRMFGLSLVVGLPFAILIAVLQRVWPDFISASQGGDAAALGFLACCRS
jgi:hypothetical protein